MHGYYGKWFWYANAKVYAPGSGIVDFVGWRSGYGLTLEIDHGFGYRTLYGHLKEIDVKEGEHIIRGNWLALTGNSGELSSGPHLHYEVLKNNIAINPINFFYKDLSPSAYDKMIELSSQEGGQALD